MAEAPHDIYQENLDKPKEYRYDRYYKTTV
jgi:hypothetical protein